MKQFWAYGFVILSIVLAGFLLSCATVTGRMENANAEFTIKENREGVLWGEISSKYIPAAVVRGDVEETDRGIVFYATEIMLFTGWPNGWTKGTLEGSGSFSLTRDTDGWRFHTEDELSLWDVVSGEIRYYDTYYRGDDALRKVKNRVDRMLELSRFLKSEKEFPPFYGDIIEETGYGRGFAPDVVSFLFPETEKHFKRKERRAIFSEKNTIFEASGADKVLGADMYWRTGYTETILPEHLIPLRNSGTLWRDYEEGGPLFYSLYNIEHLFSAVLEGSVLTEKK